MGLKIIGTGRAHPQRVVANDELAGFLDTSDEWIVSRTGIHQRRVCVTETALSLAEAAARKAVERSGLSLSDIDMILCSTISGDYITPSLACCVQERLGISGTAFDIGAACAGFVYMLDIAHTYISAGKAKHVLIISAEQITRIVDWSDRNTCVLFGDGAGACVAADGGAFKYSHLNAACQVEPLYAPAGTGDNPFSGSKAAPGYIKMDGQNTFKFAVQTAEAEIRLALKSTNTSADDVAYFLLHQANKRIVDSVRTKLKQSPEKFPVNIDRYGNTSSATVPVLLDEMVEDGKIKKGDVIVLTAFGAGNTSGTCVMVWE